MKIIPSFHGPDFYKYISSPGFQKESRHPSGWCYAGLVWWGFRCGAASWQLWSRSCSTWRTATHRWQVNGVDWGVERNLELPNMLLSRKGKCLAIWQSILILYSNSYQFLFLWITSSKLYIIEYFLHQTFIKKTIPQVDSQQLSSWSPAMLGFVNVLDFFRAWNMWRKRVVSRTPGRLLGRQRLHGYDSQP